MSLPENPTSCRAGGCVSPQAPGGGGDRNATLPSHLEEPPLSPWTHRWVCWGRVLPRPRAARPVGDGQGQ